MLISLQTVLTVSAKQPLEIVMQLFKKLGCASARKCNFHLADPHHLCSRPRVILVEQQGQLRGLITIKDILKEIIAHEQFEEDPSRNLLDAELEESLEEVTEWFKEKAAKIGDKLGLPRRNSLKLNGGEDSLPLSARRDTTTRNDNEVVFEATDSQEDDGSRRLGNPFEMRSH